MAGTRQPATRAALIAALNRHRPFDEDEASMLARILDFVTHHEDCFARSLSIGHVTGSAWIVDGERSQTLLLHHAKLNKWLQPGGHCDGDGDVARVALREAEEETGLAGLRLWSDSIFDVDAHLIPARDSLAAHTHYDIRYLIEADPEVPLQVSEESHDVKWVRFDEIRQLNTDASVLRMAARTLAL